MRKYERTPKLIPDDDHESLQEVIAKVEAKHPELKTSARRKLTINETLRDAERAEYGHKKRLGADY